MNTGTRNRFLTTLVVLLLLANAATIAVFWLGRRHRPPEQRGAPNEFLIRELRLDSLQQEKLQLLVQEHRHAVEGLREQVRGAKDSLFELVKDPSVSDSAKRAAAAACSRLTEQIDLITVDHFQKIRAMLTPSQQKKFDKIIQEVTSMIAAPRPPMDRDGPPPPRDGEGERPPPPNQ